MHGGNHWGGSFEIADRDAAVVEDNDWDKAAIQQHQQQHYLDETQQSWLLGPPEPKKKAYIDLGCIVCSRKAFKYTLLAIAIAFVVIALPTIIVKTLPADKAKAPPPDNYTVALTKALLFFDAQKSGKLPKNHKVSWRRNSGLSDGNATDFPFKWGLVGGYYDAGDNTKFHFPMSFAMSMLSWSVVEYEHKYRAIGEYDHVRDLIKWGTDYLLLTFNNSATRIDKVFTQVGGSKNRSIIPDDHTCWMRPEDMNYDRPVQSSSSASDLGAEMAAALASASIVFRDNAAYSKKLSKGAETVFEFARNKGRRGRYSDHNDFITPYYNSSGYFDEYMWGAAWLYFATGNKTYITLATDSGFPKNSKAFYRLPGQGVLSWDNKLPAAMLLMTRYRIFLNPGYPYEEMLSMYQNVTELNMCSYLHHYNSYNWTKGGMIELHYWQPQQPLQYVANAAFLANLYADYLTAANIPGMNCGPTFISSNILRDFATSQMNYILGDNPMKMSYVVGYGKKFPRHVHHRAASIPSDGKKYSCKDGFKWLNTRNPNPHNITGAMVGGPDKFDQFKDVRSSYNYTEPTLVGNAGLVAALTSLTTTGGAVGIDKNTIFSAVPPLYPPSPPPPAPWKP